MRTDENNLSLEKSIMLVEKINVLKQRISNSRKIFQKGPWNHLSRPHHSQSKEQTEDFSASFLPMPVLRPHCCKHVTRVHEMGPGVS